ncbi:hypothetical protein ACLB2K_006123 [Fragaria x ananassa]
MFLTSSLELVLPELVDSYNSVVLVLLVLFSWELASTLKESKAKFDSAGVKLIAVGVGTPDRARVLAKRLPFPMDSLFADPDRKAYDTLGLYYLWGRTFFNPAIIAKMLSRFGALRKAVENYTIRATPDDRSGVLQQGGMFVSKGKQLLYARKDKVTSDHAPLDDILNVCCNVPCRRLDRLGRRREGKAGFSSDLDFDSDLEGWWDSGVHRRLALVVGARPRRREDGYGGGAASVMQWSAVTGKVVAGGPEQPNWFGPQGIWTWAWA